MRYMTAVYAIAAAVYSPGSRQGHRCLFVCHRARLIPVTDQLIPVTDKVERPPGTVPGKGGARLSLGRGEGSEATFGSLHLWLERKITPGVSPHPSAAQAARS